MPWFTHSAPEITRGQVIDLMGRALDEAKQRICKEPKRVLLLPPDITRMHSGAGWITEAFYNLLAPSADVHVIPTLGQHEPHTREQNAQMFGKIPHERIGWRPHPPPFTDYPTLLCQAPWALIRSQCPFPGANRTSNAAPPTSSSWETTLRSLTRVRKTLRNLFRLQPVCTGLMLNDSSPKSSFQV